MNSAEVLIKFKGDTTGADKATKEVSSSLGGLTKAFAVGNLAAKGVTKAIEIFNSGLDDSINRIDTMNNFSTVMTNLGIASQDSADVIQSLSEELVGLPTTLNSAASSVQRLTSYNGDIKKSEQYFLAMNNAIIAGTNDAGMQASAMEQLTQAYTKGKPDMQDWKTLLQAMPAQLKQVANAMGYVKTDQLYEALKNGEVSMNDFMDTMVELNSTGVNGLANFETQARSNTAGIGTSITNMKTAFVRGIGGIIQSIDSSLEPMGGLSGVIASLGKAGEQAFKGIGEILGQILPTLIEVGQEVMPVLADAFKSIAPTLQNLAKTLLPAISKILKKIMPIIARMVEKVMPLINKLLEAIIPLLDPLADYLAQYIEYTFTLMEPLLDILNVILPPILDILSKLAQVILPMLTGALKGITGALKGIFEGIKWLINSVIGVFQNIIGFIADNWQALLLMIVNPFAGAFKLLYDNCDGFRNFINNFINTIVNFFKELPGKIYNIITSIPGKIKDGLTNGISKVKEGAQKIFDKIWDTLKGLPGKLLDLGKDMVKGIWNGIKSMKDWIGEKISGFGKGIVKGFKKVFNIHSPSVVMEKQIGVNLGLGVVEGLDDTTKDINDMIGHISSNVSAGIGSNLSSIGSMQNSSIRPVFNIYNSMGMDALGQTVSDIKIFSGGAKNDYNYGVGV